MTYRAPVDELRFTLEEVAAVEGLKATGAFPDFSADLTAAMASHSAPPAGTPDCLMEKIRLRRAGWV